MALRAVLLRRVALRLLPDSAAVCPFSRPPAAGGRGLSGFPVSLSGSLVPARSSPLVDCPPLLWTESHKKISTLSPSWSTGFVSSVHQHPLPLPNLTSTTPALPRSCLLAGLHLQPLGRSQHETRRQFAQPALAPLTSGLPFRGTLLGRDPWNAQHVRTVYVEIRNGDVDRALKRYKWKLRNENTLRMARARQAYYKPSDLKKLLAKESEIRRQKRRFKEKLDHIMEKRSRGF